MSQVKEFSIGIVGAGISGMALAAILGRSCPEFSIAVFERDIQTRDQGTGFDIRGKAQEALKKAGIFEKYHTFSREGSDIMRIYKPKGDKEKFVLTTPVLLRKIIPPSPESNRLLLRDALIESLGDNGTIQFQCKVSSVRQKGKKVELIDENNQVLGCFDFIVDASGFSSPLRQLRIKEEDDETRFNKYYTGITMIHGLIRDPELSCHPKIVKKLGQGTMLCFDGGRGFCFQRYGAAVDDHRASVYYMIPCSTISEMAENFDLPRSTRFSEDPIVLEKVKKWIIDDMGDDFSEDIHSAIHSMEKTAIRPLLQHSENPTFIEDDELPLILIGDALHAMPPYTGSGGNFALEDAVELASYFKNKGSSFKMKEIRKLEKDFLRRTVSTMKQGNGTRDALISGAEKRKNGQKPSRFDIIGGSIFLYYFAMIFTFVYRLEVFFHITKG